MKQTAVEYLIDQLLPKALTAEQYYHIEQAKEMEKEQIRVAYMEGAFEKMRHSEGKGFTMPTEYYNETYKSE